MKKISWLLSILLFTGVILSGCKTINEPPVDNGKPQQPIQDEGQSEIPSKTWPVSLEETISLEGMEEPITLNFFDGDGNFITYVPEDMIAESIPSEEGTYYRFYANFNGNKNEDAYLQLCFFPKDIKKPDLTGDCKGQFSAQGLTMMPVEESSKKYKWSLEEYVSPTGEAYAMLGEHNGQYFSILLHYPQEFAEGFIPRAQKIINHLYWVDTDELLVK